MLTNCTLRISKKLMVIIIKANKLYKNSFMK